LISSEKIKIVRNGVISIVRDIIDPQSLSGSLNIQRKSDSTIVTQVDKEISDFIKLETASLVTDAGYHYFSEEDPVSFGFPAIILDPIDGTRELAKGLGECVVSLAIMSSSSEGFAWIFNPFTGFEISSSSDFIQPTVFNQEKLHGYVSRSDSARGVFKDVELGSSISIAPRGSIAFKLGLLASGACDFVYSRTPKNVWDIAAGTLLCWQRGYKLFQNEKEIVSLDQLKFDGELYWCREENLNKLRNSFVKK
jgi:myo-inositol-1(or 4)-monophosphatase